MGWIDAGAARAVLTGLQHVVLRYHAVAERTPMVVDVVDEGVQGPHALLESPGDLVPLPLEDQSRDDVEGPLPVDVGAFVVDREGDAH